MLFNRYRYRYQKAHRSKIEDEDEMGKIPEDEKFQTACRSDPWRTV